MSSGPRVARTHQRVRRPERPGAARGARGIALVALVLGCAAGPASTTGDRSRTDEPGGISLGEHLTMTPPQPEQLEARVDGRGVELRWQPPAALPPGVTPAYDPRVVGYRVLRAAPAGLFAKLSVTDGTAYRDDAVEPGATYRYVVVTRQADGNESGFSNEVELRTTPAP